MTDDAQRERDLNFATNRGTRGRLECEAFADGAAYARTELATVAERARAEAYQEALLAAAQYAGEHPHSFGSALAAGISALAAVVPKLAGAAPPPAEPAPPVAAPECDVCGFPETAHAPAALRVVSHPFTPGSVAAPPVAAPEEGTARRPGSPEHVEFWDAINEYVRCCRGFPDNYVYGNTSRQKAVAEVEKTARAYLASTPVAAERAAQGTYWDGLRDAAARARDEAAVTQSLRMRGVLTTLADDLDELAVAPSAAVAQTAADEAQGPVRASAGDVERERAKKGGAT